MEEWMDGFNKSFFGALEGSLEKLPMELLGELYRPCAVACVQAYVLGEQRRQFAECGNSLDLQYEKYGRWEYFFADIIERGHIYEVGYPRCLCPVKQTGFACPPTHCECSRQSILYVLETLLPNSTITVEPMHTVLGGADECRFRVTVE